MKSFALLFSESWHRWKASLRVLSKWTLWYYILPVFLVQLFFLFVSSSAGEVISEALANILAALLAPFLSLMVYAFLFHRPSPLDDAKHFYVRFLFFGFVFSLIIGILFFFFFIPGIIGFIFWILAPYTFFSLLIEEKGFPFREALQKSYQLVRGKWWRTLGFIFLESFLVGLFVLFFVILLQGIFFFLPSFFLPLKNALILFVTMLFTIFSYFFYYELYRDYQQSLQ